MEVFKGRLAGDGGVLELVFFNQRWAAQSLKPGVLYLFYGRIEGNLLKKEIVNPYFEPASEARKGRILPLYRLTAGLTQTMVRKAAAAALELFPDDGDEILSDSLRMENQLATRAYALRNIHFPRDRTRWSWRGKGWCLKSCSFSRPRCSGSGVQNAPQPVSRSTRISTWRPLWRPPDFNSQARSAGLWTSASATLHAASA